MKRTALILISAILMLTACNLSDSEPKALLWKISGNGLEKPSYLFGTWHGDTQLRNPSFLDSIPGFYQALDGVDVYAGELVMVKEALKGENPQALKTIFKDSFMPKDTLYKDLLSEQQIAKLDSFLRRNLGERVTSANMNLRPCALTMVIGQMWIEKKVQGNIRKRVLELDINDSLHAEKEARLRAEAEVMDIRLQKYANDRKKEIIGLDETINYDYSSLLRSGKTLKEQADSLMSFVNRSDTLDYVKIVEESASDIRKAYREQDIFKVYEGKIAQVQKINAFAPSDSVRLKELIADILDNRNRRWMEKIPGIIGKKSAFIGVGAVHLGGKEGLIALLREKGYTVEPVE